MKNILIISESFVQGGSGNATVAIFNYFKKNFSVKILLPITNDKNNDIVNYYNFFSYSFYFVSKFIFRFISYFLSNNKFYFFTNIFQISLFSAKKIKKKLKGFQPDYVLILWYEYILNYKEILKIKNILKAQIIIYPFDMHTFTGGCRYVQSCNNYNNNCNNCPAIKLSRIASKNFLSNKIILKEINPLFFFPSKFSANFACKTKILSNKIKNFLFYYPVIENKTNISLEHFSNYNLLSKLKKKYKNTVFFGSQEGNEWRKGIFIFKQTLIVFKNFYPETYKNTLFIYCGNKGENLFNIEETNFYIFKFLKYKEVIKIYELADAVIIPSIQEWSSFMMSEFIFLNKYIICFDSGSSKDFIKDGINGNICDPYNFRDTARKLYKFLNKKNKTALNNKYFIIKIRNNNQKIISYLNKI